MTGEEHDETSGAPELDENGVDLAAIRANLKLTPLERLQAGDRRTTEALALRERQRREEQERAQWGIQILVRDRRGGGRRWKNAQVGLPFIWPERKS